MAELGTGRLLRDLASIEAAVSTASPARIDVAGGEIIIEPDRIAVSLPVAGVRFELTGQAPGVAQLSRTRTRLERRLRPDVEVAALHVSVRSRSGRLQLVAPLDDDDANAILDGLPELDADGARASFDDTLRLLVAARRLGTEIAQVNDAAIAARPTPRPEDPSLWERARPVARALRPALVPAVAALLVALVVWVVVSNVGDFGEQVRDRPAPVEQAQGPATGAPDGTAALPARTGGEGFVVASLVSGGTWVVVSRTRAETFHMYRFDVSTGEPIGRAEIEYPNADVATSAQGLNAFRVQGASGDWLLANVGGDAYRISLSTGVAESIRRAVQTPRLVDLLTADERRRVSLRRGRAGQHFAALSHTVSDDGAWRITGDGTHAEAVTWETYLAHLGGHVRCSTSHEAGLLPDGRWLGIVRDGGESRLWMEASVPSERRDRFVDLVREPPVDVDRGALESGALVDLTGGLDLTSGRLFWTCADGSLVAIERGDGWLVPVGHRVARSGILSLVDTDQDVLWSVSWPESGVATVSVAPSGALLVATRELQDAYRFEVRALDPLTRERLW